MPVASRAILSNLKNSELKNNPQYLSGLSRAIYPTTFLKIAVYRHLLYINTKS